ncbi:MAG: carbohydrate ABC transporter permease [Betaproteobacteria bacterium]
MNSAAAEKYKTPGVRRRRLWREAVRLGEGVLYLLPAFVIFGTFVFYPLLKSLRLSLYITDIMGQAQVYVGLQQYRDIFTSGAFGESLAITALFTVYTVLPSIAASLVLALMANWRLRGISLFRMVFSSPVVVAVASASMIWMMLYSPAQGVLNYLLGLLRVPPVNWLADPRWALPAVSIVAVWRSLGFNTILLLSGIQSIPEEIYESARIDGAGAWKMFWQITLPLLSPVLMFLVITSTINALQSFGEINILTAGGPAGATNVVVYSIYREAFFNFNFGFAVAEAMVLFAIILVLTVTQFILFERRVFYQ